MSATAARQDFSVVASRMFGWGMVALLAAFMISNQLMINLGWSGLAPLFENGAEGGQAWLHAGIYLVAVIGACVYAQMTGNRTLRADSEVISSLGAYLIRAAFWIVLLIGVVDAAISFLRVEGLLAAVVGQEMTTQLGRPIYRGANIHVPLMALGAVIAFFSRGLGFVWLALLIVVAELSIVFTRFVFSYEQAFMGDLVRFWYAALFLFASAYTLIEEGHVRVDVFYANFTDRRKGLVNAIGTILLGMTMCWVILIVGMGNKSSIINNPVMNFEVSQSGFGMYTKYLMAAFLGVFAITMLIEFAAYFLSAVANYRDEPGGREVSDSPAH